MGEVWVERVSCDSEVMRRVVVEEGALARAGGVGGRRRASEWREGGGGVRRGWGVRAEVRGCEVGSEVLAASGQRVASGVV